MATAPRPNAVVAFYDCIINTTEKTVTVKGIGSQHAKEVWYVSIIKQWFDNAPEAWSEMQWRGLEATAE